MRPFLFSGFLLLASYSGSAQQQQQVQTPRNIINPQSPQIERSNRVPQQSQPRPQQRYQAQSQQANTNNSVVFYSNVAVQTSNVVLNNPGLDNVDNNIGSFSNEAPVQQQMIREQNMNPIEEVVQMGNYAEENVQNKSRNTDQAVDLKTGENNNESDNSVSVSRGERSFPDIRMPRFSSGSSDEDNSVRSGEIKPKEVARYSQTSGKKKKKGSGRYKSHGHRRRMMPCFGF
jgi:hypothetical protein